MLIHAVTLRTRLYTQTSTTAYLQEDNAKIALQAENKQLRQFLFQPLKNYICVYCASMHHRQ